jgi:hypothetical protein
MSIICGNPPYAVQDGVSMESIDEAFFTGGRRPAIGRHSIGEYQVLESHSHMHVVYCRDRRSLGPAKLLSNRTLLRKCYVLGIAPYEVLLPTSCKEG